MKFYVISIIILISSQHLNAAIVGQGDFELGVSLDNDKSNIGVGMRYNMSRLSTESISGLNSRMQLGTDEGRSLIATSAHEYQYENSFIDNSLYNDFEFLSPRLTWVSTALHRLDFENIVDEETDRVSTDYSKTDDFWSVSTGPSYSYSKGRWIDFKTTANIAHQYSAPYYLNEATIDATLTKSISKISQASVYSRYLCSEDDIPSSKNSCRRELSIGLNTQSNDLILTADYGVSVETKIRTFIYRFSSSFEINSTSDIDLTIYRAVDSINRERNDFEPNIGATTAIKEGRNIQYLYEWNRSRLEVNARRLITRSNIITTTSEDASIFYDFQLGSTICLACSLSLNYEYSSFDNNSVQEITSISLNKNNSRRINTAISFRKTERHERTKQDAYWSINFLIMYTGIENKISNR